jgi:hypothetical protein
MAEKIVIAELDVNVGALLNSATATKNAIDALKDSQKNLKKSTEDTTKEQVKNEVVIKNLSAEYNQQKTILAALNTTNKNFVETEKAATAAVNKNITSINSARENNKQLLKIRNELNLSTKAGRDALTELNTKLDSNNKFIKDNADAYTKQKLNIGNYQSALGGISPTLARVVGGLMQVRGGLMAQSAAMKASATSTGFMSGALRIFKLALISTGIGLIVVALGSLSLYLTQSQKGMDAVSKVMKAVGAAVDVLVDRFIAVGEVLSNIFSQSIFKTLAGVKESFAGIGDEIARDIQLALELEAATQKLRDAEVDNILLQSQRKKSIQENRLAAKDQTKSLNERVASLDKAISLEKANLADQVAFANERARIAQLEYDRAKSDSKDLEGLNKIKAAAIDLETTSLKQQLTFESERQGLLKKGRAEDEKATKSKMDARQKELEDFQKNIDKRNEIDVENKKNILDKIAVFEARKRELQNEINLANAEEGIVKEQLKAKQDFEKEVLALEKLHLSETQKTELLALLTEQRGQVLADIQAKINKKTLEVDKAVLEKEKKQAQARADVAATLTGILVGLLGDSLGAKLASIAIDAAIQSGLVSISASSSTARNLAQATAALPPPLNAPLIAIASGQNVATMATSRSAISKIIGAAALQGLGTIAAKGFYEGGQVPNGTGGVISGQNIAAQRGGDNILATVKSGEVILNENQQARAGGSAFFKSIGVPGFANGGITGLTPQSIGNVNNSSFDIEGLSTILASKINDIKIVAIESDITNAQIKQVIIESTARI